MNIVEIKTWRLGRFTVRQQPRFDNPAWAQFTVSIGKKFIGNAFSCPDLACCEYLERQSNGVTSQLTAAKVPAATLRGIAAFRKGRPTNAERERRAALLPVEEEPA
jgi:hypothetical protein